jgi:hypothetical protein
MGDFLFWALVFFLGFCAVSAIGAIAQAIALKHYTEEGDPRDVAEEERAGAQDCVAPLRGRIETRR